MRHLLTIILLALLWTGHAQALDKEKTEEEVLAHTLSFSVSFEDLYARYEYRAYTLGNWELSTGTYFEYSFGQEEPISFVAQGSLCHYEKTWGTCLETKLPLIGSDPWLRLITTIRF